MANNVSLLQALRRAVRDHQLILPNQTVLVGVSGGVDSLVLLHALNSIQNSLQIHLHVATLDHRLRGDDGAADAAFVEVTARECGIPCTRGSADVSELAAERGLGIEHAARIARYTFLASVAREVGAELIAVAHHADDQAETVLLHLLRGSGITGLAGMRWIGALPGHEGLRLIRPLLGVRRDEIEAYARENGLAPREDASNHDTTYTRNKIRREVMPLLREINPEMDSALNRLADNAAVENDYLHQRLMAEIKQFVELSEGRITLHRKRFRHLNPAFQRRFVLWSAGELRSLDSDEMPVSHERTLAAVALALSGQVGAVAELGGILRLRCDYETILIERADAPEEVPTYTPLIPADEEITPRFPGETFIAGWRMVAESKLGKTHSHGIAIPPDAHIVIRTRRRGDTFRIFLPMIGYGTQSLSKWMITQKIPRAFRERLPLLVVNNQIAAIFWRTIYLSADFDISREYADEPARNIFFFSLSRG